MKCCCRKARSACWRCSSPAARTRREEIFEKWELDFAVIGITTDTSRFVVKHKGEVVADIPVTALSDEAPVYERPFTRNARP